MRGGKADGELKPYTVIIDDKGINTQGDHPAGMIVLSVGDTKFEHNTHCLILFRHHSYFFGGMLR